MGPAADADAAYTNHVFPQALSPRIHICQKQKPVASQEKGLRPSRTLELLRLAAFNVKLPRPRLAILRHAAVSGGGLGLEP